MQVKNKIQHYFKSRFFMDLDFLGRTLIFMGIALGLLGMASYLFALATPDSAVLRDKLFSMSFFGLAMILVGHVLLRYVNVHLEKRNRLYKGKKITNIVCNLCSIVCLMSFAGLLYIVFFSALSLSKANPNTVHILLVNSLAFGFINFISGFVGHITTEK